MTSRWSQKDIDVALIREFSVHGVNLGGSLSLDVRAERVRTEILRHQRENRRFYDSDMTYRDAYRECYNRVLDLRGDRPLAPAFVEEDELDDELAF